MESVSCRNRDPVQQADGGDRAEPEHEQHQQTMRADGGIAAVQPIVQHEKPGERSEQHRAVENSFSAMGARESRAERDHGGGEREPTPGGGGKNQRRVGGESASQQDERGSEEGGGEGESPRPRIHPRGRGISHRDQREAADSEEPQAARK